MNLSGIKGNEKLKNSLNELEKGGRMPHAVIISGGSVPERSLLALRLSMWAVCTGEEKPCGRCKDCINAEAKAHSDIYYAKGSGKTDIYSKDELAKIVEDSYIKPNQAARKVYVFEECDAKLTVISQNTLLKTIEEPPQDAMFILTCSNPRSLLTTIRSRATEFKLESSEEIAPETLEIACEIAEATAESGEWRLMKALYALKKRDEALAVLDAVTEVFRDGMVYYYGGESRLGGKTADVLSRRLTKQHYIRLIELTQSAQDKINKNVRPELVAVWLCAEYRRTLWQR